MGYRIRDTGDWASLISSPERRGGGTMGLVLRGRRAKTEQVRLGARTRGSPPLVVGARGGGAGRSREGAQLSRGRGHATQQQGGGAGLGL